MTSSESQAAQEYERVIAEIRSQLNGDQEHDGPLLMQCAERYREHPLAKAIIREIGRMLYGALPANAKADLDEKITDVYEPFTAGLTEARLRLSSGDADGAREALEDIIKQYDSRGDACADDAASEYRIFRSTFEEALYRRIFHPTKEVRRLPYDLAGLYMLYGTTLVELRDFDAAEAALSRARRFSPVDPAILFELSEVFKMQQRWDEYRELSAFALSVSLSADQAARGYRNLGFYFTEHGNYEVAIACYMKSASIDRDSIPRCTNELTYIEKVAGEPVAAIGEQDLDEVLRENGVQVGVNEMVREVIAEIEGPDVRREIIETVSDGMRARNEFSGEPARMAALLLSCSGPFRQHPLTPEVLRRMTWASSDQAPPDPRAKTCLAITRLSENPDAEMGFIDALDLVTTHPGAEGKVGVIHRNTGLVLAEYDFTDAGLAINKTAAEPNSGIPPGSFNDAIQLLMTYVRELTFAERGQSR